MGKVLPSCSGITGKTQFLGVSGFVWAHGVTDTVKSNTLRTKEISKKRWSVGPQRGEWSLEDLATVPFVLDFEQRVEF